MMDQIVFCHREMAMIYPIQSLLDLSAQLIIVFILFTGEWTLIPLFSYIDIIFLLAHI